MPTNASPGPGGVTFTFSQPNQPLGGGFAAQETSVNPFSQIYQEALDLQQQMALQALEKHCTAAMLLHEEINKRNPYVLKLNYNRDTVTDLCGGPSSRFVWVLFACSVFGLVLEGLPDFCNVAGAAGLLRECPQFMCCEAVSIAKCYDLPKFY